MIDLSEVKGLVGWLGDLEVENLYKYAMTAPTANAVEIGSFCGKSSTAIGLALKERGGSLICIDNTGWGFDFHWDADPSGRVERIPNVVERFKQVRKRFDLESTTTHLHMDARVALPKLDGKYGLIFIDGDHTAEHCIQDALWAYDHILPSGYIVFHDYHNPEWGQDITKVIDILKNGIWDGTWEFYWVTAAFKKS